MSYEKKIREMMDRLAAMSPEPPPYPEEMTTARPGAQKSRRPALAFATAAALVAILAIPLLLFTGEGEPIGADSTTTTVTTTIATTSTTASGETTTTQATTTTSSVTPLTLDGIVFLYQEPEASFMNNPALIPVPVRVRAHGFEELDFLTAWQMVIEGRVGLPDGLSTSVPADVTVESTRVEGDVIVAEMSGTFLEGAGEPGLLSDFTMLNQLIYTLTHGSPERSVLFTVGGEPVTMFGTDGLDLSDPVDRESFRQWIHRIHLTEPILPGADGTYTVEGVADVFEAALNVAVIDAQGDEIHEEPVMASCGSGCWGDFSVTLDGALVRPGEFSVRLFTHSAEDGSIVESITVPIPDGGFWEYTVGE
jgi:spore germination protein GerM